MADKKVRIDEHLLEKIQEFRTSDPDNLIRYPSDKHLIHMAVLDLLKKEVKDGK